MTSDRIEKKVLLHAPLARVWQAISDAREFGSWFGMAFDGPFAEHTSLTGTITMTTVDPEIARQQPLIVFELEELAGGVQLTITESGFDQLPLARRAEAYESNSGGWEAQTRLIARYLAMNAR